MTTESKRAPEDLVNDLKHEIRRRFYAAREKQWYEDQWLLLQAVIHPAQYLDPRGTRLPWHRYRTLVVGILETISKHGNVSKIRRLGPYILHAVQEHMRHHGREYYEEGQRCVTPLQETLDAIQRIRRKPAPAADDTIERLAAMSAVIPKGGRKKTSAKPSPTQHELF